MPAKTRTSKPKTRARASSRAGASEARTQPRARASSRAGASEAKTQPPKKKVTPRRSSRTQRSNAAKPIRGNPFLALLGSVQREVDDNLDAALKAEVRAAKERGSEVTDLLSALRDLCLRGGKRLRPGLLVCGYRAASEKQSLEAALHAGVALELLQAYFLIHDDWMDQDTLRRGGPSVHAALGKRFRSEHLGASAAILAGDYAVALATAKLASLDVAAPRAKRVFDEFARMQLDAVQGQQRDIIGRSKNVELTYTLKTGSYTVRGPLRIGALLAGASSAALDTLDRFSLPLGVAFQLRDDLMSAFSDPEQTGKPLGSDLRAGKRTVLLQQGLKRARGRDHRLLKSVVGNAKASDGQVRRAIDVLDRVGARAQVEARIDELVAESRDALATGKLTRVGRELLEGAADALTSRRT